MTSRAEAINALRRKAKTAQSWDNFMQEHPAEAEELIQDAMRKQNPLFPANP
jgi:hypothetical protein